MITARINTTQFSQRMGSILAQARRPDVIMLGVGREAANQLKTHFRKKDQTDVNKLAPGRREHFWRQVMNGVQAPVVSTNGHKVTISIVHPAIAQKVFGGDITAKRKRNLAIPLEPDAYGRAPKVFEQETGFKLFFIRQGSNIGLARAVAGGGLQWEYLLTPKVHQQPDKTALPAEGPFEAALLDRAQRMLDRETGAEGPK
jgi:hypothetical protein